MNIYDTRLTQLKGSVNKANITLNNDSDLLKVENITDSLFKVIPLFVYDDVSVQTGILEKGNGFFITDQLSYTFVSDLPVNKWEMILTVGHVNNYAFLWVTDIFVNVYNNTFVEIYVSNDNDNFELIGNNRTDRNGQLIYESEYNYVKFKVDGVFSDVVEL